MNDLIITSLQNPRIKAAIKLRDRRGREASGLLLIEGYFELDLARQCGVVPEELFFCPELVRPGELPLRAALRAAGTRIFSVSPAVMAKLAYREHPDAWLATATVPRRHLADLRLPAQPLLIVAEGVEKPGNLGAILRSADAAGVDAVIVCAGRTDLANPNVVRASKGALFRVPVVEADSDETLEWLRQRGIQVVAATPAANCAHWDADLSGGVAIAVGTEKEGLTPTWLEGADLAVAIPMHGTVNSLNVAQALTLLVYEALRQRSQGG
jgi:RNA methyltransferase, TrmH family